MILVAGSANLDFVVQAPHIPAPGETVLGSSYRNFPGGKGANQAVACARAGAASTSFLGAFGRDSLAMPIRESLVQASVQLVAVESDTEPTGTAFICVAANGENAITVVPGANAALLPQHLPPLDGVSHLLLQLESPLTTVAAFAQAARKRGVEVVLNAAPATSACLELLSLIDVLIVNEGELALLSGAVGSIASQMASLPCPTVVTTLGERGCIARIAGAFELQPGFSVDVVDTTAAGDTFCGALVAALSQRTPFQQALLQATAAAALACTRAGAQSSIPHQLDVQTYLKQAPPASAASQKTLATYCGLPS